VNRENITFYNEDIEMPNVDLTKINIWLFSLIEKTEFELESLNYIFCTDEYLLEVNKEYLDHDYYTDIITFDNADEEGVIESDIFVSLERVAENAKEMNIEFDKELLRVLAHGLLHLLGYKDKTEEEAKIMRTKEEEYMLVYTNQNT
jgi:rRNA maturation RNase YbeY